MAQWNRIIHGDWLEAVATLPAESIDLAYMDPPFNTGSRQDDAHGSYEDRWPSSRAYIDDFMRPRLSEVVRVLKPTGSLLLHCDWRMSHHLRLLLDELLGADRFVNHLIWSYGLGGSSPRAFARKHDDILFYAKGSEYWFAPPMVPATSRRMKGELKKATDVIAIPAINNMAGERTGYPTQKPLALLTMLIEACCPPMGAVLDPCCGSGTTLVAAAVSNRRFIGIDCNDDAVRIASRRVSDVNEAHASTEQVMRV